LPTVVVSSPAQGATVTLRSPVPVLVNATDAAGVSRVDLIVDGVTVDTYTTPTPSGQTTVAAQLQWTPATTGAHALTVIAYRSSGVASPPAVVAVTVSDQTSGVSPSAAPVTLPAETSPPSVAPIATPTEAPPTTAPPTPEPTPARTPRPTRPPTPAPPTPAPTPRVADLQPGFYNVTTGMSGDQNYVFVDVALKNFGNGRAGMFRVSVTCRGTTNFLDIDGLGAGKRLDLTYSFQADTPVGADGVSKVVVDSEDQVDESREDNNELDISDEPDDTGAPAPCSPT
jgi:hypothetical protein